MMERTKQFLKNLWMLSDYQLLKRGRFNGYMYFIIGIPALLSPLLIMTFVKEKFHGIVDDRHNEAEFLRNIHIEEHTACLNKIAYHIDHTSELIDMQAPLLSIGIFMLGLSSIYTGFAILKLHKLLKEKEEQE